MKITLITLIITTLLLVAFTECKTPYSRTKRSPIFLADREAPLGWVYLRIYDDSTFEFESRGLRLKGTKYPGIVSIHNDTVIFTYSEKIPRAGDKAIIGLKGIKYFAGEYPECLEIKMNKIIK